MPKKLKKFNKRKDKREGWMTDELLQLVNTKNDLYVEWKKNSKTLNIYNEKKRRHFRAFDKIVNTQILDETKITYYYNTFQNYKLSMKKTLVNN